jgi:hypothetical protein
MKNLKLLQIQGKYAPGWWLQQYEQQLIATLESVLSQPFLIISSRHRTDLFFADKNSIVDTIIKSWCLNQCKDYHQRFVELFTQVYNRNDALRHYFTSLYSLATYPRAFQQYKHKFNLVKERQAENSIMKMLIKSEHYLEKVNKAYRSSGMMLNEENAVKDSGYPITNEKLYWKQNLSSN